ncbi:hypothetical protein C8R45DRAFT_1149202 [Mycena sanguinolenta]|nr:hypothetical protein C8R45DRAFT_1149202 [Mycena sanguinolenta]
MPYTNLADNRLNNIRTVLAALTPTLELLTENLDGPFMKTISLTTQSLTQMIQNIKKNKQDCADLLERVYGVLMVVLTTYMESETQGELPLKTVDSIGQFTKTLENIHSYIQGQQEGGRIKTFFRQSELSPLLKNSRSGLQAAYDVFHVNSMDFGNQIAQMKQEAEERHQQVLEFVASLSQDSGTERASSVFTGSYASSNSLSVLPAKPQIFHGRELETKFMLDAFTDSAPRIAILGPGGIGKTSVAKVLLHHSNIINKYNEFRFFVPCDSAVTGKDLVQLVGDHLSLKAGQKLEQAVLNHLSSTPPCLLILDNLETAWEPTDSRKGVENFLSSLSSIEHLALIITMRGAERPVNVQWTRPFMAVLEPLGDAAARQVFADIADPNETEDFEKVLKLSNNLPLAINLLAQLVDVEGCSTVLSRWERENVSMLSDGYDKRSNLEMSIQLSLSSPRMAVLPQAKQLLSLLALLPDGISDTELRLMSLPIADVLECKSILLRTALAYKSGKQLKVLVPIQEYMQKVHPPSRDLVQRLLGDFQELFDMQQKYGAMMSGLHVFNRLRSNLVNIRNVLLYELRQEHELENIVPYVLLLHSVARILNQQSLSLISQLPSVISNLGNSHLETLYIIGLIETWSSKPISDADILIKKVLRYFEHPVDPVIKCKFYDAIGVYYHYHDGNVPAALTAFETGLAVATPNQLTSWQLGFMCHLAWIKYERGEYSSALSLASTAWTLIQESALMVFKGHILLIKAFCSQAMGDYAVALALLKHIRELHRLWSQSGGSLDTEVWISQAVAHYDKSEYEEALQINEEIYQIMSMEDNPALHVTLLLNLVNGGALLAQPTSQLQPLLDKARTLSTTVGDWMPLISCDVYQAVMHIADGEHEMARKLLVQSCKRSWGKCADLQQECLELLVETTNDHWSLVLLAYSIKIRHKRGIHKALQSLGHIFLADQDEITAASLFTAALQGFTEMDIHRSRGECLLNLGDISNNNMDTLKAVGLWTAAKPLFERSSQLKQVARVDDRLMKARETLSQVTETTSSVVAEALSGLDDRLAKAREILSQGTTTSRLLVAE